MGEDFQCWQCGKTLQGLILPMSRREECEQCHADQHVCKMCRFFDGQHCDESRAEPPTDKQKANFCDYFSPKPNAYEGGFTDRSAKAKAQLAALFSDDPTDASDSDQQDGLTAAELAEEKLRKMLRGE